MGLKFTGWEFARFSRKYYGIFKYYLSLHPWLICDFLMGYSQVEKPLD